MLQIKIPNVIFSFLNVKQKYKEYLLIAGGKAPDENWLLKVSGNKKIVCADKGADYCKNADIVPQVVLGDGDSEQNSWSWAETQGATVIKYPTDKDFTDLQLALNYIVEEEKEAVLLVTGIWGGRFDHLYSAIFSLANYAEKTIILAADEKEVLFFLPAGMNINIDFVEKPKYLSLLPLADESEVTLLGTKWELEKDLVNIKNPYSISNEVIAEKVNIYIHSGFVGIYMFFGEETTNMI